MIIPRKGKRLLHNVHVPHLFPDNPQDVLFHSSFMFILGDYGEPRWRCAQDVRITLHIGYMIIGYKVKSAIWSIFGWSQTEWDFM